MRKKISIFSVLISLFFIFSFSYKTVYADDTIYLGGMPAGFSLYTRGAEVVGLCDVITEDGLQSPCKEANIKVGDVILKIDNTEVNNAIDIENSLINDTEIVLQINRCGESIYKSVKPAKDINGKYKIGVFIRDTVNGIGTITFIKGNRFASLGHPVIMENGKLLDIVGGKLYNCNITGYTKGKRGTAGELKGIFIQTDSIAVIDKNLSCGVYGEISNDFDVSNLIKTTLGNAVPGNAQIYSTIDGNTPQKYNISIIKVDDDEECKNFVIKIIDKRLLNTTGGIIQGMSGSPIVQNGKLVGAVTHVFINDPTRGFGISIDNMINN